MDQLDRIYDYTKFHIGIYVSLSTAIIAVLANEKLSGDYSAIRPFMVVSLFCFMAAGMFGGIIASSVPAATSYSNLIDGKLKVGRWDVLPAEECMRLEHRAFWAGCLCAAVGLLWSVV